MNKEHYFPVWLIERTATVREGIAWAGRDKVSALSATVPLCTRCNSDFVRELESPMARVFDDLEAGRGISDEEAELIVRWMWKFEGLAWVFHHPKAIYTERYTLRERVLRPVDEIRGGLVLAIGIAEKRDPDFEEGAMGIDSFNVHNAVFVSGVFSRVAVLVALSLFEDDIPSVFSKYKLAPNRDHSAAKAKLFYPAVGFPTCTAAIGLMKSISAPLSRLHDEHGETLRAAMMERNVS